MILENLTKNFVATHLRTFGEDVNLIFSNGNEIETKAIFSIHMTNLKEHHTDIESYAQIAFISKFDVCDPNSLREIVKGENKYANVRYKIGEDGFYVYFLSE